jgi:mannose-6-phosphate isomerase-like protein (cupin superfamily)
MHSVDWRDLRGRAPNNFLFQGEAYGASVSAFIVEFAPGGGPPLHRHPYEEVFIIQEGHASFTVAGEPVEVGAGTVLVVPGMTPHRFVNASDGPLKLVSIHPRPRIEMEVLPE